jgi:hypothetical protein
MQRYAPMTDEVKLVRRATFAEEVGASGKAHVGRTPRHKLQVDRLDVLKKRMLGQDGFKGLHGVSPTGQ